MLLGLRDQADPTDPAGPYWVQQMATDITSLGSYTLLTLLVMLVAGFLVLEKRSASAALLVGSALSATVLSNALKLWIDRARPEELLHLVNVSSPSFPSGHAMLSATIYLTLGALMARGCERRVLRHLFLGAAITITVLVGASRVYLGVHWPSDVLAGWSVGALWAWGCWTLASRVEKRRAGDAGKGSNALKG